VIVTEHVGAADLVEHGRTGFVVPIRDVEHLKRHLAYLYEHPEARIEMGRAAAAAVAVGHTWADYGDRLVALLDAVLERPPHRPLVASR
jgi:glycosyltransferase involved in cell wall biosynthesis